MRLSHPRFRLPASPAPDVWHAPTSLTVYALPPRSTVTVALDAGGLRPGDVAGLALFVAPFAWVGVERGETAATLVQVDASGVVTGRRGLSRPRLWLQITCDFARRIQAFAWSEDGARFSAIGEACPLADRWAAAPGIPCSVFAAASRPTGGDGAAEFEHLVVTTDAGAPAAGRRAE